jgi:hypothetical protein
VIILPGLKLTLNSFPDDIITIISIDYAPTRPRIMWEGSWWPQADLCRPQSATIRDVENWLREGWHVSTR